MDTGDDDLVSLDWDDDAGDEPAREQAAGWRRFSPLVALAVVALLVVAASLAGGDEGGGDRDGDAARGASTSTTTTSTTEASASGADDPEPSTTTTAPQFASEPTGGRRLVFLDGRRLVTVDLDADTISTRAMPFSGNVRRFSGTSASVIATGHDVFLSDGNETLRLSTGLGPDEEPRRIGPSVLTFRSARTGRVWLTQQRDDGFAVTEVDGSGRVTTSPRLLPPDTVPVDAAGDAGLVLTRGGGELFVWNPANGAVRWESPPGVALLGVAGTNVVWQRYCDGPVCSFHVTDALTGADRTYALDGQLWMSYSRRPAFAVHPNGRTIAASLTPHDVAAPSQVLFVDVSSGARFVAPATQLGTPLWSPDGEWLFLFGGTDGPERMHVSAAVRVGRIEEGHLRMVTLHVPREAMGDAAAVL